MTLLTIVQSAADELSLARPSSVIDNTDDEVVKLLRFATKAGETLMRAFPWQVLRAEQTFTGVSGEEQTSILPSDFDRFVPETFWNRDTPVLVSGPVSPVQWQGLKATSYTGHPKFTYRGDSILILPALSGGESLAFEYISKNWCESSGGTARETWAADTDVSRFDEELHTLCTIYQYEQSEDLPWQAAYADYRRAMTDLTRNERAAANILAAGDIFKPANGPGRHFTGAPVSGGWIL